MILEKVKKFIFFNKKSIKTKFFIFFIITSLIYGIILYLILYATYYKATLKQVEITCINFLEATRVTLSAFINETYSFTKIIYNDQEFIDILDDYKNSETNIYSLLRYRIEDSLKHHLQSNNKIKSIRLYIDDKKFYVVNNDQILVNDHLYDSQWYFDAIKGAGKLICKPTYSQEYRYANSMEKDDIEFSYSENIISFIRLIKNNKNESLGILVIDIEENTLASSFQDVYLQGNFISVITTDEGKILSSSTKNLIGKNVYENGYIPKEFNYSNKSISKSINGIKHLITQKIFYFENWKIVIFVPLKDLFVDLNIFNRIITSFLLYFSISSLILGLIMTNIFTNPINKLINAIDNVKEGDFSSRINTTSKDEIARVEIRFNQMLDSIEKLLKENYEIKLREKEAQIKSLEAQINPHFLYNTLDTIGWKVLLMGGGDISKIINSLSQILRYSINQSIKVVKVKEEINQIKNYLYIQETRYEDRFNVHFNLSEETLDLKINKLLIQPIVENSIIHGLEDKEEGGVICISSKIEDNDLLIEIFDNGKGIRQEKISLLTANSNILDKKDSKNHIGINNVHNRLKFYYGEHYGIKISSRINSYTKIILRFPVIK